MLRNSHLENECRNKCCQEEKLAAEEDAATAKEKHLLEIQELTKDLVHTKRKLANLTEDFESTCRSNDELRKSDLGLFYPKMDYMDVLMPGEPGDISIGQHLSQNPEVILLCKYLH